MLCDVDGKADFSDFLPSILAIVTLTEVFCIVIKTGLFCRCCEKLDCPCNNSIITYLLRRQFACLDV